MSRNAAGCQSRLLRCAMSAEFRYATTLEVDASMHVPAERTHRLAGLLETSPARQRA